MIEYCARSGCVRPPKVFYPSEQGRGWCDEHDPGDEMYARRYPNSAPAPRELPPPKRPKVRSAVVTQCVWCGCDLDRNAATREHVVPRSRGGSHAFNMAPACWSCNQEKADMTAAEYLAWRRIHHPGA